MLDGLEDVGHRRLAFEGCVRSLKRLALAMARRLLGERSERLQLSAVEWSDLVAIHVQTADPDAPPESGVATRIELCTRATRASSSKYG